MEEHPPNELPTAAYLRAVVDAAPHVMLVIDRSGSIQWVSAASETLIGERPEDLVGRNVLEFVIEDDAPLVIESLTYANGETGYLRPMEFRFHRPDGTIGLVEAMSASRLGTPPIDGILVQLRELTDRRIVDQVLEGIATGMTFTAVLQLLARLIEEQMGHSRVVVGIDPVDGSFELAASTLDIVDQRSITEPTSLDPSERTPWARAISSGRAVLEPDFARAPAWVRQEAEAQGFEACWVFPVAIEAGGIIDGCLMVWRTVSGSPSPGERMAVERAGRLLALALERRQSHGLLMHAARHDTLTGLPNRSQFFQRLARDLRRKQHLTAVLYLDLDGFKPINDRYGHRAGDQVLITVARRIEGVLRPDDLTGRLGGDEFGVICPRLHDADEVVAIAERLIDVIARPVTLPPESIRSPEVARLNGLTTPVTQSEGRPIEVVVGVSIGIAFGGEVGTDHEKLVELADAAMYHAKRAGHGCWRFSAGQAPDEEATTGDEPKSPTLGSDPA